MLKSKRDGSTDSTEGLSLLESSWPRGGFFTKRRADAEKEVAELEAVADRSRRMQQSRKRVQTAQDHSAELIAAEIAIYKAAFETNEERRQKNPEFFDRHVTTVSKPDPKDPTTWRRPNLDKLKASIYADWQRDRTDSEQSTEFSAVA